MTITRNLDKNFALDIGVVSPRDWSERIVYNHYSGYIEDNKKDIKEVKIVKATIYIEDTLFMIVNKNEHIREVTIKNTEQTIFKTFYRACKIQEEKVPFLCLKDAVTIEIETGRVVFANFLI